MAGQEDQLQEADAIWVVIPAAGVGKRMQSDRPKQYLQLCDKTVIENTLNLFIENSRIHGIVVAVSEGDPYWPKVYEQMCASGYSHLTVVKGGDERCHSVLNALDALANHANENDWVLVHDAARPCLRRSDLDRLIDQVATSVSGGLLGTRVRDTMKRTDENGIVSHTEERQNLWHALTPQMFRLGALRSAYRQGISDAVSLTDEASAIERQGHRPIMVEGHADNIKITLPEDLLLAEFFLKQREQDG